MRTHKKPGQAGVVLARHERSVWVELFPVEDVKKTLKGQHLKAPGENLLEMEGAPTMYDKKGNVWPKPAEGWTLWQAVPMKK